MTAAAGWAEEAMTRIINQRVRVHTDGGGRPVEFVFRGRHRVARILESWKEADLWWHLPVERRVYRVQSAAGGIFELEYRRPAEQWYLYKAYD